MAYPGKFIGPFPARAFALASVVVTDPTRRHGRDMLWRWAVMTAAEKLTGWSYAMTYSGEVRSFTEPRTTPIPNPEAT